ncbi:MAG: Gfo/Idh/MocA family oxidoreductase [Lachnospiraceae bacterium]|nr:Gfo/Idh/MocA family oxidoreductase [Lachnospiraceae bacterium]
MINVAIVGTGNIANMHVQGLLEFPERCRIVALCDIYPEKAKAMKEKYKLKDCEIFADHKSMLAAGIGIDVVHVCTPPYVHSSISIDSMDAGCNVLCEKPMAASVEECRKMLDCEKKNGVVLGIIAQNRFRNGVYKLKKLLDSGLAGKVCFAEVESAWWRAHSYYDLWWRGTWEKEGGGPTLNHAVHHIDMLNWMMGREPSGVIAMLSNVMHDNAEVEDISVACVKYGDNSMARILSSVIHHGEEQGITLQCEKAKIAVPFDVKAETGQANGFPKEGGNTALIKEITEYYNSIPDLKYEGHTGEIDNYLSAIETGTRPLITGEDGMRTIELITAIYAAGITKRQVEMPISMDCEFARTGTIVREAPHFYEKKESVENFEEESFTVGNYK